MRLWLLELLCLQRAQTLFMRARPLAPRLRPLHGATADYVAEAFNLSADESADVEARIIAASSRAVAQLLKVAMQPPPGADEDDRANLLARCGEVREELRGRTEALAALGLSDAEVARTVKRVPEVLAYPAARVASSSAALRARLGLDANEFKKKIALRLPQALGLTYDTEVGPELDALGRRLALADDELRRLVLGCPQILGLCFAEDVEPNFEKLVEEFGGFDAARAE
eukprot:CAMPEP_0119265712 /NCGR_PEP_ID=MMETSP1329-20130426/4438_1 /TAXON_ID=114041 /ORGANISM="Genus nov. species nov., Strain RCC1024" /LENGTH=228 /DNA_ID=CAMNT_0007265559 /DNA_START=112 /DNA_END=795 /DNA_ORIENTATION=+